MLEFRHVDAGYGRHRVLVDVTMHLDAGFHIVLGPNGAGKTTLFRVGAGILPPQAGTVAIEGRDLFQNPAEKRHVAYLSHRPALASDLTVRDNLEFWGRVLGLSAPERRAAVADVAEALDLHDLLTQKAGTLSRGQSQRVAIARALLGHPRVFFLDEPTTGLDPDAGRALRQRLQQLGRDMALTIIFSTHNLAEAQELAQDVVVLQQGRLIARGDPNELAQALASARKIGFRLAGDPRPVFQQLGYQIASQENDQWVIEVQSDDEVGAIVKALVASGVTVLSAAPLENSLEHIYFSIRRKEHD
ncbi:ABC transporter ATP-binding protein [Sulfobacillus acidophilus TPY]|uniref:Heme exporter protein CcmA n=1 Tax=Sulfobacillus acidophilus (strain ATCC 700253 / DSM 10332 / NAL) TaxID=679936 RepID=G8U0G7_SULAD|nr:ABC transporter ATP-binding protein [Sulfobacillus acidophilus TPY]AEW04189.1 heme exporter protein CcmA [Sulfobacillus acidophilus DSM 10332]